MQTIREDRRPAFHGIVLGPQGSIQRCLIDSLHSDELVTRMLAADDQHA